MSRSGTSSGQVGTAPQPGGSAADPFSDLSDDPVFEAAGLQVAVGQARGGEVVVAAGDKPLVVTAPRGWGRVTLLLFSPEREPFRSWKNLPVFWAKLAEVPGSLGTSRRNPSAWWLEQRRHLWRDA